MSVICKKCKKEFEPKKGLISYCSLVCRNSRSWTDEDREKKSKSAKKSEKVFLANKLIGEKKTKNSTIKSICVHCQETIEHLKSKPKKYHSECWLKCSGGYRKNSTIKHRSFYNGFKMDSNSEKLFAMKCDEFGINWKKNEETYFEYIGIDNKKHKYYPDFYLENINRWVEIKGKYYSDIDENFEKKINSVNNLLLIYSKDIKNFNFGSLV